MSKKKVKIRTKLDQEQEAKRKLGEMLEELEATGQESEEKAAKWVQEKGKEERKEEDEKTAEAEWKAHDARKKVITYKNVILAEMRRCMIESYELVPYGFAWYAVSSKRGLVLYVISPESKVYARGMELSTIPKYDLNCVYRLVDKALNHMDILADLIAQKREDEQNKKAGNSKKTKSGIILS